MLVLYMAQVCLCFLDDLLHYSSRDEYGWSLVLLFLIFPLSRHYCFFEVGLYFDGQVFLTLKLSKQKRSKTLFLFFRLYPYLLIL